MFRRLILLISFLLLTAPALAEERGIYITQSTLENTKRISQLIRRSKNVGINTFIIDCKRKSARYARNIHLVKKAGIKYVVRIVVFPGGGSHAQVNSKRIWAKRLSLAQYATRLGADEVQLDYIRYSVRARGSRKVANVHRVIQYFQKNLSVPLQIAVFGEASFGRSRGIGQDLNVFANSVDVVNPMVYPSHYKPYRYHSNRPHQTIYRSLQSLKALFSGRLPFRLVPYIEVSNFRYPMTSHRRVVYIRKQIKATRDAGADGWYAWSPRNKYDYLFRALEK